MTHSLRRRYVAKVVSKLFAALTGLVTVSLVPRALGAGGLGQFEFVQVNFAVVLMLLSLSVPQAAFNWFSRHKLEDCRPLIALICLWMMAVYGCLGLILAAIDFAGFAHLVLPGIDRSVIYLGLAFAAFTSFGQVTNYLGDGFALTVGLETGRLILNAAKALTLALLFFLDALWLQTYLIAQIALLALFTIGIFTWFAKRGVSPDWSGLMASPREHSAEFIQFAKAYCGPLVFYSLFSMTFIYFERWLLQYVGGAAQQGYYGYADKLGNLAFLFTAAMTPVLTREFAAAHGRENFDQLRDLFDRIKLFYAGTAIFGVFVSLHADFFVRVLAGDGFIEATLPVALMGLYTIHRTFGQLGSSLLMATGRTKTFSKISSLALVAGLPISYVLLSSPEFVVPGLGLGGQGLAIKMVVVQLVLTNVYLFINCRFLELSYGAWLLFQVRAALVPALAALAARYLAILALGGDLKVIDRYLVLGVSAVFYGLIVAVLVWLFYRWFGIRAADIDWLKARFNRAKG